jgi:HEAT repeat protein
MSEVDALVAQLRDERVEVRAAAAEQLCHMGSDAHAAACALVTAAGDDPLVREWAVAALEELGTPDEESIAELTALTASDLELVAYWAITLLGRLEEAALPAEPALVNALNSSIHDSVRQRAAWALGKIGGRSPAAIDALQRASQTSDARLARLALQALPARD